MNYFKWRKTVLFASSLVILMGVCSGFEYEMQNKVVVFILPNIDFYPFSGSFSYEFNLFSSPKSLQSIRGFRVVTKEDFNNVKTPYGWEFCADLSGREFRGKRHVRKWKIPAVFWSATWAPNDASGQIIPPHNNVEPSPNNIKPGTSLGGFSFESQSLPGISPFFATGFRKLYKVEELPEGFVEPHILDQSFKGVTVGPVPVEDKSPSALIGRLISLTGEVPKYEWIKNPELVKKLQAQLESVKDGLQKGDSKTAKTLLTGFIADLDGKKGKEIQENAWALLKANAEYLIFKLGK